MKIYSIERIQELMAELNEFNNVPLAELVLTKNGETIAIPPDVLEEWRFTGLSNKCFLEFELWNPQNSKSMVTTIRLSCENDDSAVDPHDDNNRNW